MKIIASTILVLSMVSWAAAASAQTEEPKKPTHQNVRVVTGCLSKDGSNEYKLATKDGSAWEVKSDAVKLGEHVGHMVTLTGTVDNAAIHGAKEDVKGTFDKDAKEHGNMTVTKLKMESKSCNK